MEPQCWPHADNNSNHSKNTRIMISRSNVIATIVMVFILVRMTTMYAYINTLIQQGSYVPAAGGFVFAVSAQCRTNCMQHIDFV